MNPETLVQPLTLCSGLLRHYRDLTGKRPVDPSSAASMVSLHEQINELARDAQLNSDVAEARDRLGPGRFQFGNCHKVFHGAGRSATLWAEEATIVQPLGIDRAELVRARKYSEKLLSKRDADAIHPLAGPRPIETLLGNLQTKQIVTIGQGQGKLGRSQRRHRAPLVRSDYMRVQGAVFLLADTAAWERMQHVYPLSYALAVACACC